MPTLYEAAGLNNKELVIALLNQGADVNSHNPYGGY